MFKIPPGFKTYLFEFCGYGRWLSSQGAAQHSPPGCGGTRPKPAGSSIMWLCWSHLPRTGLLWGHKCKEREQGHPTPQGGLPSQDISDDFSETVSQVLRGRTLEMAVPGSVPDKSMCFPGEGESLSHRNSHVFQSSRKTVWKVFSHSEKTTAQARCHFNSRVCESERLSDLLGKPS